MTQKRIAKGGNPRGTSKIPTRQLKGPLARKQLVIEILNKGGADRATAAYDELQNKDAAGLHRIMETVEEEGKLRAIQRLLARYKISWTREHHARRHGTAGAGGASAGALPGAPPPLVWAAMCAMCI